MRKNIFISIFALSAFTLLAAALLGVAALSRQSSRELRLRVRQAAVLGAAFENAHLPLPPLEGVRMTVIAPDGTVLSDSAVPAPQLDNHSARAELRKAWETGSGEAARFSDTLSRMTYYYALRLDDGRALRISESDLSVFGFLSRSLWWILSFLSALLILAYIVARFLTAAIIKPISMINVDAPRVIHPYPELAPLVAGLEKSVKMRREFSANVSHELKTPLTSILGYAEIIENGVARPEDIPHFALQIHGEASRLLALIEDIIKLSHLDENAIREAFEPVNLCELCRTVCVELEDKAALHSVTLEVSAERALFISGIPRTLHDLVYNLCDNAIIYNRSGGSVRIMLREEKGRVLLSVKDTGIGIEKKHHTRVFERFYRVDKSRSKASGGTGLGLSIVRHGAELHGGRVHLESVPGSGTEVTILF